MNKTLAGIVFFSLIVLSHIAIYSRAFVPAIYNRGDNYWYIPTAQSLLAHGSLDLAADYGPLITEERARGNWMVIPSGEKWLNHFPPGTSLISLPLIIIGNLHYASTPRGIDRDFLIAAFSARTLAALSAGFLFVLALLLTGSRFLAAGLAFVFGLATTQLSIHAGGLWSHNASLTLSLAGLILLLFRGGFFAGWSIIPLSLAFAARPTAALLITCVFIFLLWKRDYDSLLIFAGLGLVSLLLMSASSFFNYGQIVPPYFAGSGLRHDISKYGFRFFEALAGHLISPNRGLLFFMPQSLFSFAGLAVALRQGRQQPFFVLLSVWVILEWMLASANSNWWHGYSFGPRGLAETAGGLVLLLIPCLHWLRSRNRSLRIACALAFALVTGWALFANTRGAISPGTATWNSDPVSVDDAPRRVWDAQDLQILR